MGTDRNSVQEFEHSDELRGLEFNYGDSIERFSKQSSKDTIEDKMMILDYGGTPEKESHYN